MDGLVYVNHGRVIVDCPFGCGNAYRVRPGETSIRCEAVDGCQAEFSLIVPDNLAAILTELRKRPSKSNRNWFPTGHPIAEQLGCPTSQTPEELRAEYAENALD